MRTTHFFAQLILLFSWMNSLGQTEKRLPSIAEVSMDSVKIDSTSFDSKVSIITFFSLSCAPCKDEIKALFKLKQKITRDDFQIVIISNNSAKKMKNYIENLVNENSFETKNRELPKNMHFIIDDNEKLRKKFGVRPIPATFFIDQRGIIVEELIGYPSEKKDLAELIFQEKIQSLLH